jgi:two-component system, NtrC family, sensor kinase
MSDIDKVIEKEVDWRLRVFDSLTFPTLVLNPQREIISANRVFLEQYNLDSDEVLGKKCHEILYLPLEYCVSSFCPLANVIKDKKGHSIIKRIPLQDGSERWEDRVFSPILNDNGELIYIIESIRDITRQKNLERVLKETEDFLEKLVQSSASAIVAADRNGDILLMNQAAEELFGFAIDEAVQAITVEDLYPPGTARAIMKWLRDEDHGGKGKLSSTIINIKNADGEEIPVEITAAIIYDNNREVATMGIYNDLREKLAVEKKLKEAQLQLAQTEKMASLGQLAAGVAHEINNPLTGILFYANLAMENLDEDNPLREDLEFVIEDVHRCKDIVKNLLAYSRQQNPTRNIIHLNALLNQSLALIRDQKVFKDVHMVKDLSDSMMLIHADKNQLSQVVINLVMNAVDAMNEQGNLILKTYRDKALGKVFLEIQDSGTGIPVENLSKIFDPFFTTKELGKGTGLGLSTAYGIVQENGGKISVKETGPQGTIFLVELPLYQVSEDTEED